jgi:hypothetical protein
MITFAVVNWVSDRTVLIWVNDGDLAKRNHKSVRVNISLDSANHVAWSPDSKAFLVSRIDDLVLEVYKIGKKPDGSMGNIAPSLVFPKVSERDK